MRGGRQSADAFRTLKSEAQQDLQALHWLREGLIRQRTVWINQAHTICLAERGIVLGQGTAAFRRKRLLEEGGANGLS